jgi:hypothetical protein
MPKKVNEIMALLKRVGGESTSLDMLMEMEKTFDNANLYAYKNWLDGELVEGPTIDRYWFTTMWMYPYKMMPDPAGSLRLLKYGCKVSFAQDTLLEPSRVLNPEEDLKGGYSNERKQAKILKKPVWLVQIEMPRKFVDEAHDALLQFEDDEIDMDDINAAYDEDLGGEEDSKEQEVSAENDAREAEFDEFADEEEV